MSETKDWCTPPGILDSVRKVFGGVIDLDPCSNPHSLVDARVEYRLPANDGLRESWDHKRIFVNPPYGSDLDILPALTDGDSSRAKPSVG